MTENNERQAPAGVEAVVSRKKAFSIIWVVPLVAFIIGSILAVKAVQERGTVITIAFSNAEGLEPNKTKIKYKEVEVGQVKNIHFSQDLTQVIVKAEIKREAAKFLTEETRFWVVRARIAVGEVSGLGTLFSGAFIGMEPGREGKPKRHFQGLETPPVVTAGQPGRHFLLTADSLGSLGIGSPVYYRQIKVGQVVEYGLNPGEKNVHLKIFINSPHHLLVQKNTRFWNASGIDLRIDAEGVKVNTESLITVLEGGIAFDTPPSLQEGGLPPEDHVFRIYPDRESTRQPIFTQKSYYLLHFTESVRGLVPGASVEFRGMKIGEVVDVRLQFDRSNLEFLIPVLIYLEPERIEILGEKVLDDRDMLQKLVSRGLRAQLKIGNLVTGHNFIDLDFHPDVPPVEMVVVEGYPEIPTIPSPIETVAQNLSSILKKIGKLPLEEISQDLRTTMARLNTNLLKSDRLLAAANQELMPQLTTTIAGIDATLVDLRQTWGPESVMNHEISSALEELGRAARAARILVDYLERHPEALIKGKGGP